MKIVIPSFNRAETIRTHQYLEKGGVTDYKILLHSEACKAAYLKNPTIRPETLLVTGAQFGIQHQRQWIITNYVKKDEWFLTMDDNVRGIQCVHPFFYNADKLDVQHKHFDPKIFQYEANSKQFIALCLKDIAYCEKQGIKFGGFASVPNYYFLGKKYRHVGYVISKIAIIKNSGITYDPNVMAMEDYAFTAENLLRFGKVLINNFIIPQAGHYEVGGIGTYEQRVPRKIIDCEYLMQKYPGLFRYKIKAGCHPKAELQVRFTTTKQVEEWRSAMRNNLQNLN
jgi:hypothetical protein